MSTAAPPIPISRRGLRNIPAEPGTARSPARSPEDGCRADQRRVQRGSQRQEDYMTHRRRSTAARQGSEMVRTVPRPELEVTCNGPAEILDAIADVLQAGTRG